MQRDYDELAQQALLEPQDAWLQPMTADEFLAPELPFSDQTPPPPDELVADAYADLVDQTAVVEITEATMKDAEQMMLATPAGRAYLAAKETYLQAEQLRKAADTSCRETALWCWRQDPDNQHPHRRITIQLRERVVIHYSEDNLLKWVHEHPDLNLVVPASVDRKRLEKYARAVREVAPLQFVSFELNPTVAISLDDD